MLPSKLQPDYLMLKTFIAFFISMMFFLNVSSIRLLAHQNIVKLQASDTFVAYQNQLNFTTPEIILYHNPINDNGVDWEKVKNPKWDEVEDRVLIGRAANYLQESLGKMTGKNFSVVSKSDFSKGIILTLIENAPVEIRNDENIQNFLSRNTDDKYSNKEAFFIKIESHRTILVANTADGLLNAAVDLMESIGYEILGMGPRWIYVPNYSNKKLEFSNSHGDKPSYYIRGLTATSGQNRGVGTVMSNLKDKQDESVADSYWRWIIGARIQSKSMPSFPGHALYKYQKQVLNYMRSNNISYGFLAKTQLGLFKDRPDPTTQLLWINTDLDISQSGKVFSSDGKEWKTESDRKMSFNLDLSVPYVRQIILEDMKRTATLQLKKNPDKAVVFGIEPEDGLGSKNIEYLAHEKNWYTDYLISERVGFGNPYILHNFKGLNQPTELWDSRSESNMIYGAANWLLREFDKWIDSLPEQERKTSLGINKKDLIRCSFYSYNFHDVPPDFNSDRRIRVMVGGYPKNRGSGKWEKFVTKEDIALALKVMLPDEPMADRRIISLAKSWDIGYSGVNPRGKKPFSRVVDRYLSNASSSAMNIADSYKRSYDVGFRAIAFETDFNFGKQGLEYYLTSKVLWDATFTPGKLESIRDKWLKRSFGSGWSDMKAYYNFMLVDNYPQCNGPSTWSKAVKIIDAASRKIEAAGEVDELKRIDDVKQYWYNLYLFDTKQHNRNSKEFKTYLWKGQMSYMVAMHALLSKYFNSRDVRAVVGNEVSRTPAHYTHQETQVWWNKVMSQWVNEPASKCM
jgi:hypothetical protein